MKTKRIFLLWGCVIVLGLAGCASPPAKVEPTAASTAEADEARLKLVEPEAKPLYLQAERAFDARNLDLSLKLFQQLKAKHPRGKAQVLASYRLGIIYYYRESYAAASKEFEYFVTHLPQSDLVFDATYNWAACEHQLGRNERAYQVLSRLKLGEVQAQGPKRAETVFQLTARVASAVGNTAAAIAAYSLQLQLPIEEGVRSGLELRVDEQLALMNQPARLQALLNEVNDPTVKKKIEARIAQLETPRGSETPEFPKVPTVTLTPPPAAQALPSGGSTGASSNIGVVLPLTGKWASYGKRALDGILLAAKVFSESGGGEFNLFIKDSASNTVVAQNAVDELSSRHSVMAILGPISTKEAAATGERAQALGIPNISLSTKEGVSEKSPYLFQTGLSPSVQIENLVKYAVQQKGYKRFAILAPNNPFGRDMAQSFWDEVTANGATVASYQLYPPEERDFQDQIRNLTGLEDLKYRRLEVAKLNDYIRETKAKTGKEPKVQLAPLIDFDAIFIPDSPKAVSQAAASLNYYDVNKVPLLGTAEWNSEQFYRRGASLIQTALFPAGLFTGSSQPRTQEFVRTYQEAYGQVPDLLAAQAYEAMEILAFAIRNARTEDRNRLANEIAAIREFDSPMGKLSFDNYRVARRKLAVLTLEGGTALSEH